jgi:hypothetical protein
MIKTCLIATSLVLAATTAAHAGGAAGSIGLGAEFDLNGVGGVSLDYDAGMFNTGIALGFADPDGPDNTTFDVSGRFYWHVAKTAMADFGLGGALALQTVEAAGATPNTSTTNVNFYLEPGFQIRVFIVSNVALSFDAGLTIGVAHDTGVAITGQGLNGEAGVTYYF